MEKFYLYLLDKRNLFLKRDDIERYFKEFLVMWDLDADFSKVFDTLRKRKLTYMFDDYWALSKDNPLLLISSFLDFLGVLNYYGLETALYLNKKIWQPPLVYYLLNTTFTKTRKIAGITIKMRKIPFELYNKKTLLVTDGITYSDYEKTCLDLVYFKRQKYYAPDDVTVLNLYLGLYAKYPYVKDTVIEHSSVEERGLLL